MVSREDCVTTINDFLKTKDLKTAAILFNYLCELKGEKDNEAISAVTSNPTLLSFLLSQTLEALQQELKINKITDRNNNLISVF